MLTIAGTGQTELCTMVEVNSYMYTTYPQQCITHLAFEFVNSSTLRSVTYLP